MNLFDIEGKVIVVTGAAGLLGQKHAEAIAGSGGIPILIDIASQKLAALSSSLKEDFNVEAGSYALDITNEMEIENNSREIVQLYGKIDGLVNNAANNPKVESEGNFSRLENFPIEQWNKDIEVSLTGSFICSKHYGSRISENKKGGSIVNISSDLGLIGPNQKIYADAKSPEEDQPVKPISYSVVKTGLIGLTRYLATYWADKNVRCNALAPGGVQTSQDEIFIERLESLIPLGRMANQDEYQGALIFLLSNASAYMTGATLVIDGGRTAW